MTDTQADDVDFSGYAEVVGPAWVLVPEEPTPEMVHAGREVPCEEPMTGGAVYSTGAEVRAIYAAMIAAAPPPPAGSDGWREALEAWRLTDGYHPAYIAGWNAMLDKALSLPTPPVAPRG